jgi:hypothetical protein
MAMKKCGTDMNMNVCILKSEDVHDARMHPQARTSHSHTATRLPATASSLYASLHTRHTHNTTPRHTHIGLGASAWANMKSASGCVNELPGGVTTTGHPVSAERVGSLQAPGKDASTSGVPKGG